MRAGKIVALIAGILIVLIALGLLIPGGVLLGLYGTQRDSDGFFHTSSRVLSSNGSALVTPDVDLSMGPLVGDWLPTGDRAAIRIEASSSSDENLFVGIGPSADVSGYLEDVDYDEVTDFGWGWRSVSYRHMDGTASAAAPGQQDFWVASSEGQGTIVLDWDIANGSWTAAVMNADGSAPVRAEVSLGARFDILLPIGIGLVVGGVVLLAVGILLIVLGARRPPSAPQPQAQVLTSPPMQGTSTTVPPAATPSTDVQPPSEPPKS